MVREPLPDYTGEFIPADALRALLQRAQNQGSCLDAAGNPLVTLIDYRIGNFLPPDGPFPRIRTNCPVVRSLLDEMGTPEVQARIPKQGRVVLLCETGNRDPVAMRYLYKFGYSNVKGLRFGMRGWLKLGYPVVFKRGENEAGLR